VQPIWGCSLRGSQENMSSDLPLLPYAGPLTCLCFPFTKPNWKHITKYRRMGCPADLQVNGKILRIKWVINERCHIIYCWWCGAQSASNNSYPLEFLCQQLCWAMYGHDIQSGSKCNVKQKLFPSKMNLVRSAFSLTANSIPP
jgi:hypothetical protein